MALKFGTSGVRGLVTEMTDLACYLYARAYARYLKTKTDQKLVSLAGDYRGSTPRIMRAVGLALEDEGLQVDNCGFISTPAVTLWGMAHDRGSIMVTGSHIPDDRNGIKFNMPWGEVLKPDEAEISRGYAELVESIEKSSFDDTGMFTDSETRTLDDVNEEARKAYVERYVEFFPGEPLEGMKLVFYQHSTVCRDFFVEILRKLGAEVITVGRSDDFIPVDTEAVSEPERLAAWVAEHGADALVTADGDGDRPLAVDEKGTVIRGDVLGILVADSLGADAVATPVSCNTALEKSKKFKKTYRTRIGSPYVIAAMNEAVQSGFERVVGYEANGGFLTATTFETEGRRLPPLPTRDAALPILALLLASRRSGRPLSTLVAALPERYTMSGLQRGVPNQRGKALVARFADEGAAVVSEIFGDIFGKVTDIDLTDGARITFESGDIVHLRPSGNAPEFRCYTESETVEKARSNNARALSIIKDVV